MRKKKRYKLPPFVPLTWKLLNSPAFIKLTFSAAKALPYFLGKVIIPIGDPTRYESSFTFSYPEAKRLGFETATFSRITKELVAFGFIEYYEKGGLRGKGKGYNKYILSKKWESYGKEKSILRPKGYPPFTVNRRSEEPDDHRPGLIKRDLPDNADVASIVKRPILIKRKLPSS